MSWGRSSDTWGMSLRTLPNQVRPSAVSIAFGDDIRIRRALAVATNIDFYRYEVNFRLRSAGEGSTRGTQ